MKKVVQASLNIDPKGPSVWVHGLGSLEISLEVMQALPQPFWGKTGVSPSQKVEHKIYFIEMCGLLAIGRGKTKKKV